ncbi:uncharacterized protein C8A04DRAFT_34223 [Dichotomopilus funicola]|uniref:Uncharacterized protein n=1 Tax=Dichotomopilus funicola TaxID=1934379 RepID=A0AAN6VCF1_9PEZI|nr:hypothetical protein C8A04DRAFT_34223 [Dichotomopilus funicola]
MDDLGHGAVLGVLPILYNTVATLVALSRIKRMLRHSKLTALTRSDVVNRVIEVELPRYAVRPMDRLADRDAYWTLSRHPSSIPGGSWTTFNWRMNVIGLNTQRVEYADQLRQPQVDVAFDELVCYLLDLGAHPDPHGFRLLRSSGLWTPVGCTLMRAPDGVNNALTIAPLDGSDGHLSLAVTWTGPWTTRDHSHLPPYWVRLYPAPAAPTAEEEKGALGQNEEAGGDSASATEQRTSDEQPQKKKTPSSSSSIRKTSLDSTRAQAASNARNPITCQISADGILTALSQSQPDSSLSLPLPSADQPSLNSPETLYIDHLRIRSSYASSSSSTTTTNPSIGTWFASAATAYGTSSQTILWNYKILDSLLAFARRETVPCGVLVLLGMADEDATPEWDATGGSRALARADQARQMDEFMRRTREQRDAMAAEARMSPVQRAEAARARSIRESEAMLFDMRERHRVQMERAEARTMEALQSPKWDAKLVAEHSFPWLVQRGEITFPSHSHDDDHRNDNTTNTASTPKHKHTEDIKTAVGHMLHRMVLDGAFAADLGRMLDLWKAWADNAGMRKADLAALQEDPVLFAYATLLVAVLRDAATALEGTVAMDLQECLRLWRTVRLG